jgi:hypothetical protein
MEQNVTTEGHKVTLQEQVASNVRAELAASHKAATDLVQILHLGYRACLRRYNGEQPFSLSELSIVARALSVPVSALMAPRLVEVHEEAVA